MGTVPAADGVSRLLFGSIRREVLFLLFGRPDERFYVREILRAAGGGSGAVQRELKQLAEAGLVRRETEGRQVFYSANRDAPIFPELQSILQKTAGVVDVLRSTLATIPSSGKIKLAFVYGSVAAGRQVSSSDVDLMVIGDITLNELLPALRGAQTRLSREVNPSVFPAREFKSKVRQSAPFVMRVLAGPKLFVIGGERELGRLAR